LVVVAGFALALPQAWSQGMSFLGDGSAPLEINADKGIEWQRDKQVYVARGNALARRGEFSVAADTLAAYYREGEDGKTQIYRIDAIGNVVIASTKERVYGDRGVYSMDRGVMQLTGDNLRLETPEDVLTAEDSLEYWENYEGKPMAVARGNAMADRPKAKQRIRGDVLTATLGGEGEKLEIVQVDGFGDVRLSTEKEFARGDRAVYYVKDQFALLEGNVKITSGDNQLNGERGEIDLKSGVSRLLGGGDRVRGLLSPEGVDLSTGEQ
jgi:lipopolysaccharide export system protein LptA